MNKDIFIRRLKECRKRKYKTQQDFADAYKATYGTIRDSDRPASERGMFGTVQSWEQGKTTPTAEVLSNICEILDCDADYLLGRIDERNHTLADMRAYTGLSTEAIEQLHEYAGFLSQEDWWLDEEANENYFHGYTLFLIDELLNGSKRHKIDANPLARLYEFVYEDLADGEDLDLEDSRRIDFCISPLTQEIAYILSENARKRKFPPALGIRIKDKTYQFRLSSRRGIEPGEWED